MEYIRAMITFLEKPNRMHALSWNEVNQGALRETFFVSQVSPVYSVRTAKQGGFLVSDKYTFEVGGHLKDTNQIKNIEQAYIAADGLEYPVCRKIPLWQFGLVR